MQRPTLISCLLRRRHRTAYFFNISGPRDDFDIVIVGSGIGGGVLADDLAERVGGQKRILVLEAGSFVYPTHVYNVCRFSELEPGETFRLRHVLAGWKSGTSTTSAKSRK